jgi:hypothetical protein
MYSQTYNAHKLVLFACLNHFTRIEFNQILVKHDNGIETRIKEMRGPSTTYFLLYKTQLRFPLTGNLFDEAFPNPAIMPRK